MEYDRPAGLPQGKQRRFAGKASEWKVQTAAGETSGNSQTGWRSQAAGSADGIGPNASTSIGAGATADI